MKTGTESSISLVFLFIWSRLCPFVFRLDLINFTHFSFFPSLQLGSVTSGISDHKVFFSGQLVLLIDIFKVIQLKRGYKQWYNCSLLMLLTNREQTFPDCWTKKQKTLIKWL